MAFTTAILVKLIPRQNKSLTSKTVIVCRMLASPQTIAISPISGVRYMVYRTLCRLKICENKHSLEEKLCQVFLSFAQHHDTGTCVQLGTVMGIICTCCNLL